MIFVPKQYPRDFRERAVRLPDDACYGESASGGRDSQTFGA